MGGACVSESPRRGASSLPGGIVVVGHADDEKLGRRLRRVNAEIADGCVLELACSPGVRGRGGGGRGGGGRCGGARGRDSDDGLVLLGVLSSGAVAVVPVVPGRTARQRLLSLSDSIAECAMLLGLGTSLYGMSVRTGD